MERADVMDLLLPVLEAMEVGHSSHCVLNQAGLLEELTDRVMLILDLVDEAR